MNRKSFLRSGLAIGILAIFWVVMTPALFPGKLQGEIFSAPHPGFIAPSFTLETPFGEEYSLDDFHGKPTLVLFWASWCSVCKTVMPGLEHIYQEFSPQGFQIFAINATQQDILMNAINYFTSQGYSFPMLVDANGDVSHAYYVRALPTAALIDRDGKITDVIIGSSLSEGFLRSRLDQLLSERSD